MITSLYYLKSGKLEGISILFESCTPSTVLFYLPSAKSIVNRLVSLIGKTYPREAFLIFASCPRTPSFDLSKTEIVVALGARLLCERLL